MPENWCLQTVLLGKTPENPLASKEIKAVNLKGNEPQIFTGRTNAEAEAPVFWSSYANRGLILKVPDAGKDWRKKGKRVSEDEMAWWHHQCNEHELGQTLGVGEGQGGLSCYSPWGHKELDMNGWLNKSNKISYLILEMHTNTVNHITNLLKLKYHILYELEDRNFQASGFSFGSDTYWSL